MSRQLQLSAAVTEVPSQTCRSARCELKVKATGHILLLLLGDLNIFYPSRSLARHAPIEPVRKQPDPGLVSGPLGCRRWLLVEKRGDWSMGKFGRSWCRCRCRGVVDVCVHNGITWGNGWPG